MQDSLENAGEGRKELLENKRLDYFNVFYATEAGRRVLFDLYTYFQTRYGDDAEYAMANAALQEVYLLIKSNAGINEKDVIDASVVLANTERDS